MNQAKVRESDVHESGTRYLEPDASDEPKTEPRIRISLPPALEPSGAWPRVRAEVMRARRALTGFRFGSAVVLGALLGSAPYLVQQHVRARASDVPKVASETSQLAVASAPAVQPTVPEPPRAPAPLPPPSAAAEGDEMEFTVEEKPRPTRSVIERALFAHARKQLSHGDAIAAQLVLARLDRRVPHGNLMRQRKLLEIQVLQAIGAKAAARRAANDFAKAYPQSPELNALSALLLGS